MAPLAAAAAAPRSARSAAGTPARAPRPACSGCSTSRRARRSAPAPRAGALAAADRLVVREPALPKVTLFIVPCPFAGSRHGQRRAPRCTTSTIRLEVSTLPATTAAGNRALTRHPLGRGHLDRLEGAAGGRDVRVAASARRSRPPSGDGDRAVDVARLLRRRCRRSRRSSRRRGSRPPTPIGMSPVVMPSPSITSAAGSGRPAARAIAARDPPLGVARSSSSMPRCNRARPCRSASSASRRAPSCVAGDLGPQVGQPLLRARMFATSTRSTSSVSAHRRDHQPLLDQLARAHGHAGRRIPPTSAWWARETQREPRSPTPRDQRDVGQVGAAGVGVVDHADARPAAASSSRHGGHGVGHRAQMHGDVLGLRDHPPAGVEHRRRAVAPLLDVGRMRGADQRRAHLLGDAAQARAGHHLQRWPDRSSLDAPSPGARGAAPASRRPPTGWPRPSRTAARARAPPRRPAAPVRARSAAPAAGDRRPQRSTNSTSPPRIGEPVALAVGVVEPRRRASRAGSSGTVSSNAWPR